VLWFAPQHTLPGRSALASRLNRRYFRLNLERLALDRSEKPSTSSHCLLDAGTQMDSCGSRTKAEAGYTSQIQCTCTGQDRASSEHGAGSMIHRPWGRERHERGFSEEVFLVKFYFCQIIRNLSKIWRGGGNEKKWDFARDSNVRRADRSSPFFILLQNKNVLSSVRRSLHT
jgi:hypothetical protein